MLLNVLTKIIKYLTLPFCEWKHCFSELDGLYANRKRISNTGNSVELNSNVGLKILINYPFSLCV